jgi:hypothetical protein
MVAQEYHSLPHHQKCSSTRQQVCTPPTGDFLDMASRIATFSSALMVILYTSFAAAAPVDRILIDHNNFNKNPIFESNRFSSLSEWFSAQGRILEIANNATNECLSQFRIQDDNSVCYGDDRWDWDIVAIICVASVILALIVGTWLCCDWLQTCILWFLSDLEEEDILMDEKQFLKSSISDGLQEKVNKPERRVDSVHSQSTDGDRLTLPDLSTPGFSSPQQPRFRNSDSHLQALGWLP